MKLAGLASLPMFVALACGGNAPFGGLEDSEGDIIEDVLDVDTEKDDSVKSLPWYQYGFVSLAYDGVVFAARKLNGASPSGSDWVYVKSIVLHPKGKKAKKYNSTNYDQLPIKDWSVIQGKLSSGKKTLHLYWTSHPLFNQLGAQFQQGDFGASSEYAFYWVEGRGPSDGCDGPCFKAKPVNKAKAKKKAYEMDASDLDSTWFDASESAALMETLRNNAPVILEVFVDHGMGGRVRFDVKSAWLVK